jgi:hypothetical protein
MSLLYKFYQKDIKNSTTKYYNCWQQLFSGYNSPTESKEKTKVSGV